jgi:hypothetical protein
MSIVVAEAEVVAAAEAEVVAAAQAMQAELAAQAMIGARTRNWILVMATALVGMVIMAVLLIALVLIHHFAGTESQGSTASGGKTDWSGDELGDAPSDWPSPADPPAPPTNPPPLAGDNCQPPAGSLRQTDSGTFESPGGLVYGPDPLFGSRVQHVLNHTSDNAARSGDFGVFDVGDTPCDVFYLLDEAWRKVQSGDSITRSQGARTAYDVDMGRTIGYAGGQGGAAAGNPQAFWVRLVVEAPNRDNHGVSLGDLMLHFGPCPFNDQGLIRPVRIASGKIVLLCDEDETVWFSPTDIGTDRFFQPTLPDWTIEGQDHIRPGTIAFASLEEVRDAGWDAYLKDTEE